MKFSVKDIFIFFVVVLIQIQWRLEQKILIN